MLDERELSPKRSLGQNFLIDQNFARKIAEECSTAGERLLEIGPGLGALTLPLAERVESVFALEKDQKIVVALEGLLKRRAVANVEVIHGDALQFDLGALMDSASVSGVVGNLPYNISVPFILRLIEEVPAAAHMVFLVQTEVAQRLCAVPGTRESSFVSLKIQLFCEVRIAMKVPNTVFLPVPNVSSSLVSLKRSDHFLSGQSDLAVSATLETAKRAFAHRRQMLRRTLNTDSLRESLLASGVDPTRRPESLAVEEWLALGEAVMSCGAAP